MMNFCIVCTFNSYASTAIVREMDVMT